MNPKIWRNFEVLSPCDFTARITRHIPSKSFQIVRYYGGIPKRCATSASNAQTPKQGLCPKGPLFDSGGRDARTPLKNRHCTSRITPKNMQVSGKKRIAMALHLQ